MFESFRDEPKSKKKKRAKKTSGRPSWIAVAGTIVLAVAMVLFLSLWMNSNAKFQNQKQETQTIENKLEQAKTDWNKTEKALTTENSELKQKVEDLESANAELKQERNQALAEKRLAKSDEQDMRETALRRAKQYQEERIKNNKLTIKLNKIEAERNSYQKLYKNLKTQLQKIYNPIIEKQKKEISRLAKAYGELNSKLNKKK